MTSTCNISAQRSLQNRNSDIQSYLPIAYVPISLQLVTLTRPHHVRITPCAHPSPCSPTVQRPTCYNIASQRKNKKTFLECDTAPAPAGGTGGLGDLTPYRKIAPLGDCMRRLITCPSYAYPVGTVVFDANNHEAN